MEEILKKIADPKMRSQIEKVAPFHGYLSTGAFAGIQMLNIARRVLEASEGDRLFVTCETYNCLPDPFQVLAGIAIGNKGLKIKDHGKMAVTVTMRAPVGTNVKGVRIMLDPAKTARYPRLHAWFMKQKKSHIPKRSPFSFPQARAFTHGKSWTSMFLRSQEKRLRSVNAA